MRSKIFGRTGFSHLCIAIAVGIALPMVAFADHNHGRKFKINGVAVTGINDFCGLPVASLPVPAGLPPTIRATNLGEYDPDGALPIPLSPTNCRDDIVIATSTDTAFLAAAGIPDIDPRLKNLPLREVPVVAGVDGKRRVLPPLSVVPGNALPPTKSDPNDTLTLGDWLSARGRLHLRCKADGTARVRIRFRNLVPNGVYTMWGVYNTTPPESPSAQIVPVPLGGVPNVIIPDSRGRATYIRDLSSCPKDVTEDGSRMMFMTMAYHSDANVSGAVPEIGAAPTQFVAEDGTEFSSTFAPGAVTHDHVMFLISGEHLELPAL